MRKKDHQRIARAVAEALRGQIGWLSSSVVEALEEGSVSPDTHRGWRAHHHSRERDIRRLIAHARLDFLHEDYQSSAYSLGEAFHYIADMTCRHYQEERISDSSEPRNIGLLQIRTPYDIADFLKERLLPRAASVALKRSAETCCAVADMVWRPLTRLHQEETKILESIPESKLRAHSRLTALGVILVWGGGLAALSLYSWKYGYLFWIALGLGLILLITMAVLSTDEEHWKLAVDWYGLNRKPRDKFSRVRIIELNRRGK